MTLFQVGPRNTLTDVPGIRVSHLTRVTTLSSGRRARAGATVVFALPTDGRFMRPAAVVASGGQTEVTGLCYVEDFGFMMTPIMITGLRAVGRVHDAMVSRRPTIGWPPTVIGMDDGRLSDQRGQTFTEQEVIRALESASNQAVPEGAVGAGAGLVAFGFKSGVGSASRRVTAGEGTHFLGALALTNLGRTQALRLANAGPAASAGRGAPPLLGSAVVVIGTDAPLDDRQCRRLASAACLGLGRIGAAPGPREGLVAFAVSTGVLLTRGDRTAPALDVPRLSDEMVGTLAEAAAEAAEDAAARTLTSVDPADATDEYPAMRGR